MNLDIELLNSVLRSVTERALASTFALLIAGGWITKDQAVGLTIIIVGAIGSLVVYVYSYYKNKAQLKLRNQEIAVALRSSALTPVDLVKQVAKAELAGNSNSTQTI